MEKEIPKDNFSLTRFSPTEAATAFPSPGNLSSFARMDFDTWKWRSKEQRWNPFIDGPVYDETGGGIFVNSSIVKSEFSTLMKILDVPTSTQLPGQRKYAAYLQESENAVEEGFLTQLRLVGGLGLRFLYNSIDDAEYDNLPIQPLPMAELMWEFYEREKSKYDSELFSNRLLNQRFPVQINRTYVSLGFGLMVENSSRNIFRIWSRARLICQ